MLKKRCISAMLAMALLFGMGSFAQTDQTVRVTDRGDGFTDDTKISELMYLENKDVYHRFFKMELAGPGLTAWDYATGKGVNVALFDAGVDVECPELKGRFAGCYNAVTKEEGISAVTEHSHGTMTSKILAENGNDGYGLAGVAYDCNFYFVQVDRRGPNQLFFESVLEGIRYAISKNCRVISMSISEPYGSELMEAAINEAYQMTDNSILFVASGGNSQTEEYRYPSSYDNVLSVAAVTYSSTTGEYTVTKKGTYNDRMDVAAPGNATSPAAAYAAGVAALLFEVDPTLTAAECADIITSTAKDAGTPGYDKHYGYGIIQPLKAVQKAKYKTDSITRKISVPAASYEKRIGARNFFLNATTKGSGVIKYTSSDPKVCTVSEQGEVTIKGPGKATIQITAPESGIYQKAVKNVTVTVKPDRAVLTSVNHTKTGRIQIRWKKADQISGYQIQVAKNRNFTKAKTYEAKRNRNSKVIFKLDKGTYYVRIRAYKTSAGKKVFGDFSKAQKVVVKK